jgi:hypothetical protein
MKDRNKTLIPTYQLIWTQNLLHELTSSNVISRLLSSAATIDAARARAFARSRALLMSKNNTLNY